MIEGGMHRLALALEQVARAQGVVFRYGTHVSEIEATNGAASGVVVLSAGQRDRIAFDAVISNADANAVANGALGQALAGTSKPVPAADRSLSALTWTLSTKATGLSLLRHNVLFSRDYKREFDDIFVSKKLPREPTVYICAQDRDNSNAGQNEDERFLVLVNAPATGDDTSSTAFNDEEILRCEQTISHLMARCGLQLNMSSSPRIVTTPIDWHRLFPAMGGALYGRASHGWMASFRRPGSRTRLSGLYLASGSAHPGPGIAMAALSGRLAAQALLTDQRSTRSWHVTATSGGMSMR